MEKRGLSNNVLPHLPKFIQERTVVANSKVDQEKITSNNVTRIKFLIMKRVSFFFTSINRDPKKSAN
jgi:hypothetical protein